LRFLVQSCSVRSTIWRYYHISYIGNYWPATQTNQYYQYATHPNINYSYATLPIEPLTATSLMLVILALTFHNRFNTIILIKSYLLSQLQLWSASVISSPWWGCLRSY
jgi:hypothetical protein